MRRDAFTVALPAGTLFGLATISFFQVANHSPAFSPSLREASVLGDWRLAQGETHYLLGDYYFQLGYGYLQADTASLLLGSDDLLETDAFDRQMQRAIELLRASLEYAPGRAGTWTSLAWASVMRDDQSAAGNALRTSWQLAPYNYAEAADRLAIIAFVQEFAGTPIATEEILAVSTERDVQVLEMHNPGYLAAFPEDLDYLFE
jgi:hypothetical protein